MAGRLDGAVEVIPLPEEMVLVQATHTHAAELLAQLLDLVWRCLGELGDRVFCVAPADEAEWALDTTQTLAMAHLFGQASTGAGAVILHERLARLVPPPYVVETATTGHVSVRRAAP